MVRMHVDSSCTVIWVTVLMAVTALLAGCAAQGASPSVAATTAAAQTASAAAATATASPTVGPSSATGSPRALCALEPEPCPLTAGTYSSKAFLLPFVFTLTSDWTNDRDWPHGGEIYLPMGAVQWASGVKEGTSGGKRVSIAQTPADFVAFLRKEKGFTVSDPSPVTIGGVPGQSVDLLTNETAVHGIYFFPEDAANVDAGEKIRYFLVPKDGDLVIMTIDAFKADQFDEFAAQAQPIIDSIQWQP